jgi:hypothetical protein
VLFVFRGYPIITSTRKNGLHVDPFWQLPPLPWLHVEPFAAAFRFHWNRFSRQVGFDVTKLLFLAEPCGEVAKIGVQVVHGNAVCHHPAAATGRTVDADQATLRKFVDDAWPRHETRPGPAVPGRGLKAQPQWRIVPTASIGKEIEPRKTTQHCLACNLGPLKFSDRGCTELMQDFDWTAIPLMECIAAVPLRACRGLSRERSATCRGGRPGRFRIAVSVAHENWRPTIASFNSAEGIKPAAFAT